MSDIETMPKQVARGVAKMYRRLFIKRRTVPSGVYEDEWQDISQDVVSWGAVNISTDPIRRNKFTFSTISVKLDNSAGRYDDSDNQNSIWYGYMDHQRTLVKVECGFIDEIESSTGQWDQIEYPGGSYWDVAFWDAQTWDETGIAYMGMVSGDVFQSSKQVTQLRVTPLTEVFRQRAASNLSGYSSSLTASGFMEMVRDHQDGAGNYLFLPFFGNTTTGFSIDATTQVYSNLDTSTAEDLSGKTVWDVMEQLAEAEDHVLFVQRDGTFRFASRATLSTTTAFQFFGGASYSSLYRNQVKQILSLGKKYTNFYSRVKLTFRKEDTTTSYHIKESAMTVGSASIPWAYGERTLEINNLWIPTSTVAETLVDTIYNNASGLDKEIKFNTSFVPHLDLYDRITMTYDPSPQTPTSLWDENPWADSLASSDVDLVWDDSKDTSMVLDGVSFDLTSISLNLDRFESTFVAKEA